MPRDPTNLRLGLAVTLAAAATLAIWIPLDVETGLIEQVRRQVTVGDALAPTLAAGLVGLGALLLLSVERNRPEQPAPTAAGLAFLGRMAALIAASLLLMRWTGPFLAAALSDRPYRLIRDTPPWSWTGIALGGTFLVAGTAALAQGRLRPAHVLVGVLGAIAMIALYDLPFQHLLLPPNGDVR